MDHNHCSPSPLPPADPVPDTTPCRRPVSRHPFTQGSLSSFLEAGPPRTTACATGTAATPPPGNREREREEGKDETLFSPFAISAPTPSSLSCSLHLRIPYGTCALQPHSLPGRGLGRPCLQVIAQRPSNSASDSFGLLSRDSSAWGGKERETTRERPEEQRVDGARPSSWLLHAHPLGRNAMVHLYRPLVHISTALRPRSTPIRNLQPCRLLFCFFDTHPLPSLSLCHAVQRSSILPQQAADPSLILPSPPTSTC